MKIRTFASVLFALLASSAVVLAAAENLDQATCPISGQPVSEEETAEWNGGTVYFCCPNCPGAFEAEPEKFATKANFQLVQTGQAHQTMCPISGHECDADQSLEVNGVTVCFCCENCLGAAEGAEGDEQLEMLFGQEAFEKGYEVGSE